MPSSEDGFSNMPAAVTKLKVNKQGQRLPENPDEPYSWISVMITKIWNKNRNRLPNVENVSNSHGCHGHLLSERPGIRFSGLGICMEADYTRIRRNSGHCSLSNLRHCRSC